MVHFSLAFTQIDHDEIAIDRSDWNRLDNFNLTQKKAQLSATLHLMNTNALPIILTIFMVLFYKKLND